MQKEGYGNFFFNYLQIGTRVESYFPSAFAKWNMTFTFNYINNFLDNTPRKLLELYSILSIAVSHCIDFAVKICRYPTGIVTSYL
jgi:hypothetical protein